MGDGLISLGDGLVSLVDGLVSLVDGDINIRNLEIRGYCLAVRRLLVRVGDLVGKAGNQSKSLGERIQLTRLLLFRSVTGGFGLAGQYVHRLAPPVEVGVHHLLGNLRRP